MIRATKAAVMVLAALTLIASPADARGGRGGGGRGGGGGFCNYCGCKGGPGWRAPDGKCVGHRNITKLCGSPPAQRCKKEG